MAKNNFSNYRYFLLVVITIFLLPGILQADFAEIFLKYMIFKHMLWQLLLSLVTFWSITLLVVTSVIKIWLLKRKLSVPWKFKPMEKLSLATLAETIVEFFFLLLIMWLFQPAVYDVLNIKADAAAPINSLLLVAIVIPWYCIMGTISMLILIKFLTTLDKKEVVRQYLTTSALLSLILPVLLILIIAVRILFFKGNP